jgi:hypothetical protein
MRVCREKSDYAEAYRQSHAPFHRDNRLRLNGLSTWRHEAQKLSVQRHMDQVKTVLCDTIKRGS